MTYRFLWLLAALTVVGCQSAREPSPPNVLIIVVDTLRKDALGCYGNERDTSPNIDALARESDRYDNAFSQAPWTTPSVASMLTSLYPSELGIRAEPNILGLDYVLLPEILQQAGYQTAGVVSHFFLGAKWNFHQGFEFFDETHVYGHDGISSGGVSDEALSFLEQRDTDRPFFLFLHYFDPHYNYLDHDEFPFSEELDYRGPVRSGMDYETVFYEMDLSPEDREYLVSLYDSEVAFTDSHIGRVLGHLKETGLFDDTLIVFTSDHGEEFEDHGQFGHTKTLYDELINVPLLIKYPGSEGGRAVGRNVGLIDLFPTLLEYLGIPVEHPISGTSFLGRDESVPVFSETSRWVQLRAAVADDYKLIWDGKTDTYELYDLEQDPGELNDVHQKHPEIVERMKTPLWAWVTGSGTTVGDSVLLTLEEIRALKSLGYLKP